MVPSFHSNQFETGNRHSLVLLFADILYHISWSNCEASILDKVQVIIQKNSSGNTAYIGGIDGKVYGIDIITGKKAWEYTIGAPVASSAAVSGNAVVIGAYDGNIYAFVGE